MFPKYLPLLWANLWRHPARTGLTFASIVIAFMLFGVLQAVRVVLLGGPDLAGADRVVTYHKVSRIKAMPIGHVTRMRALPGVAAVSPMIWLGGSYQDDKNLVLTFIVEPQAFLDTFTEYEIPEEQRRAWLADRASAVVGTGIAKQYGWKVGDTIPLRSSIYTRLDGSTTWSVKIVGMYEAARTENINVYMHYDYFNKSHTYDSDVAGWIVTRAKDADRAPEVARQIDAAFANSAAETATVTESADSAGMAAQLGSVGALLGSIALAVFVTMLLVTANTMSQAIRERTNEIGVLKTLGFSGGQVILLIVGETLLIVALGAATGFACAHLGAKILSVAVVEYFPSLYIPTQTYAYGAAFVIVFGALAAILPCAYAWRLRIAESLRAL